MRRRKAVKQTDYFLKIRKLSPLPILSLNTSLSLFSFSSPTYQTHLISVTNTLMRMNFRFQPYLAETVGNYLPRAIRCQLECLAKTI